jgi:hypothetical protein
MVRPTSWSRGGFGRCSTIFWRACPENRGLARGRELVLLERTLEKLHDLLEDLALARQADS